MKNILFLIVCILAVTGRAQQSADKQLKVTGTVLDAATSKPLGGMSISLPGISAAMTADNGTFTIKVPSYDVELSIQGPAYQQKRVALKGRTSVVVKLHDDRFKSVYENVLTPLGDINNSQITHSVTAINGTHSLSTAVSPDQILQGNVAGLNTLLRSGMDGSGANMYLRGFNSIYSNNQPLLVIDGMILENISAGVSLIDGYLSTPLGTIDVKDIERITVLKDAATLYGTRGANGAIVIETMRSKEPATRINVQMLAGMNMKPASIPMLNASQAKKYLVDMYQNNGYTGDQIQNLPFINNTKPILQNWGLEGNVDYYRYNKNTDWQNELFCESFKQDYSLNVTGGDEVAVYALSLGYLFNEGVVKGTDYSRFRARINTDINISARLKVQTSMSFVYGTKNLREEGSAKSSNPIYTSLIKAPFMVGNVYDASDLMSPNFEGVDMLGISNPMVIANKMKQENSNYGFLGNVNVNYNVWRGLSLSTLIGLRYNKEREQIFMPSIGLSYDELPTSTVSNKQQHRVERMFSLFNETRANYLFKFSADNQLNATLGMRYQNTQAEDDWGKGYNSASDNFTSIQYGLNTLRQTGGSIGEWNWLAFYANANYALKNRYFLTATASLDASSRYGSAIGKFQAFPAISAAWLLSSESFMRELNCIDMLKLRVGYSMTGNDDIGNFTARHYYVPQNMMGNYGLVRGNIVNPHLKPERVARRNVGLDIALFNERLSLSADFYKSKVTDMITYSSVSPVSGFSTYVSNGGEMENKGIDLAFNARLLNTTMKWDLGATASFYKNEVTKLDGNSYITNIAEGHILTQVGNPLGLFYGYQTKGIYLTSEEAQSDGLRIKSGMNEIPFQAGDVRFVNHNDDKYIDESDMTVIGDPNPDVYGSISSNLSWKRFTLSALFTYSVGNDIYNYTRCKLESMSDFSNQTQAALNRWQVEGQVTNMPRLAYGDPIQNSRFSDRWIEDGSYLKFKNITLSYDLPIKSNILTGMQIYAAADNLCTLTSYKGYDPEFSSSSNPLGYGIDAFITPQTRTFYVGIKVGL